MATCQGTTRDGHLCSRNVKDGELYCWQHGPDGSIHASSRQPDSSLPRRKLNRQEIVRLIKIRGSAKGLDLSYTDLSNINLGLKDTGTSRIVGAVGLVSVDGDGDPEIPPLDGAIFGKYADLLSGTVAKNAMFCGTSLRRTKWTYADLRGSNFFSADLTEADLRFVKLNDANMAGAKLAGANLCGADLSNVLFRNADLSEADLYLAKLSGSTDLRRANLGRRILQEDEKAYTSFVERAILPDSKNPLEHHLKDRVLKAVRIYERLRAHFEENSNFDDATWAYRRERRMRKLWSGQQSSELWKERRFAQAVQLRASWVSDWLVELLCDYGESIWRVIFWLLALLFLIGPASVSLFGGLSWNETSLEIYFSFKTAWQRYLYGYFQYLIYMLDTITTANFSDLRPATDATRMISGAMAMTGIFLTGLLGFVAGNRIRRS